MCQNLVDTEDFCRVCRGRGGKNEPDDRNGRTVLVWERCYMCEGTGLRTVRVGER